MSDVYATGNNLLDKIYEADPIGYFKESTTSKNNIIKIPETGIGDVSDGYHTFNELYNHRAILFSVICNTPRYNNKAWKSKKHEDGSMYDDMFIVGIQTPKGQATYHYNMDKWDLFDVVEIDHAPKYDGHTPDDVLKRLQSLV